MGVGGVGFVSLSIAALQTKGILDYFRFYLTFILVLLLLSLTKSLT